MGEQTMGPEGWGVTKCVISRVDFPSMQIAAKSFIDRHWLKCLFHSNNPNAQDLFFSTSHNLLISVN